MKQIHKSITLFFMLVAVLNVSFGMVKYSHLCNTTNEQKQGFTKQTCKMEMEKPSCHKPTKEPCCEDLIDFDSQDQIKPVELIDFTSLKVFIETNFIPYNANTTYKRFNSIELIPRPPNLRYCLVYQQILC